MIEAKSVLNCCTKYHGSDDPVFRDRCILVKEERAELVKHHLSVLWTDFFKPPHLEQFPQLHELFWNAIKQREADRADNGDFGHLLADRSFQGCGRLPTRLGTSDRSIEAVRFCRAASLFRNCRRSPDRLREPACPW
jgi:hypothetical protein